MPEFFWSMLGSAKHWESFGMLQRHLFGTFRSQVRVSWLLTSREAWGSPIWIRKMSYNRISLKETRLHNKSHSAVQSLEMSSVKGSGKQKSPQPWFKSWSIAAVFWEFVPDLWFIIMNAASPCSVLNPGTESRLDLTTSDLKEEQDVELCSL